MKGHADSTMTDSATEAPDIAESVNKEAGELIRLLRCSKAPDEALSEASEHIHQALAVLAPWLQQGEGWSTISIASDTPGFAWQENDLTACMPYSPISGRRNAMAPPIRMWSDNGEVFGEAIFSPTYAGPPNAVHGGIIAAVFDEVLSMANVVSGMAGFTGSLTIKYHKKTPLDTPIELWGVNIRNEGRKQLSRAEMRVDGQVTASAEGLFISAAK